MDRLPKIFIFELNNWLSEYSIISCVIYFKVFKILKNRINLNFTTNSKNLKLIINLFPNISSINFTKIVGYRINIRFFYNLTKLQIFECDEFLFNSILNLKNLTSLSVTFRCNFLNDIDFSNLKNLTSLEIFRTKNCLTRKSIINIFKNLTSLIKLSICESNTFSKVIISTDLFNLKNLSVINFTNSMFMTDDSIKYIFSNLVNVTSIDLTKCIRISNNGISHIKNVKYLKISQLNISGSTIKSLKELEVLDISYCEKISDKCVIDILFHLKNINNINIEGCNFNYSTIKYIQKFIDFKNGFLMGCL